MKKIFTVEINDRDKKYKNKKIVDRLNKLFLAFSEEINNEKEIYIKFKRVGNVWENIVNNTINNDIKEDKKAKRKIKVNLKVIK